MWLWSRLEVACKWLAGGYVHHAYTIRTRSVHHRYSRRTPCQQALGRPWGAFGAALGWLCHRFGWLCSAFPHSAFRIPHSPQGVFHKHPEYSSPYPPLSAWSGGTLVPPYTHRTPQRLPFKSGKLIQITFLQPFRHAAVLGFGCWMLHVGCLARAAVVSSVSIV